MKNTKWSLMLAGVFLCTAAAAFAQELSKDEKKLAAYAVDLDKSASRPEGPARVNDRIKEQYGVTDARVQGLRDQKLGYGEISIALGLAQGLPGGITDENVAKIVALRQGPPVTGWGKLAGELGLKLGPVVGKAKKISAEVRKHEKAAEKKRVQAGKMRGNGKPDKAERPQHHHKAGKRGGQ